MTYKGRVKNGVVVLDKPAELPEGAEVSVRPIKGRRTKGKVSRPATVYDRYKQFIGVVKDMPSDMSVNLDHYLYGAPKQK